MKSDDCLIWHETERKELLTTPVFTVTQRHSIGPDGTEGDYIVNEARDWVIVIAEHQGQFLMVKQWRHGEGALSIEFPGGVIERGEDPAVAGKRELKEETGCEAKTFIHLGTMNPNPALFSNKVYVYYATDLVFTDRQNLDADEFLNCFKMNKDEVLSLAGKKEAPHALMAAALALYLIKRP